MKGNLGSYLDKVFIGHLHVDRMGCLCGSPETCTAT